MLYVVGTSAFFKTGCAVDTKPLIFMERYLYRSINLVRCAAIKLQKFYKIWEFQFLKILSKSYLCSASHEFSEGKSSEDVQIFSSQEESSSQITQDGEKKLWKIYYKFFLLFCVYFVFFLVISIYLSSV